MFDKSMDIVVLNLRGTRFEVTADLLKSVPYTTLARLDKSSEYYNYEKNEYFFNRDPEVFNIILNYLVLKELHIPRHVCGRIVRMELQFWRIQQQKVSQCCWHTFYSYNEDRDIYKKVDNIENEESNRNPDGTFHHTVRMKLWKLITDPGYSIPAMIWHYFFLFVVLLSSLVFCLWTIPDFRTPPYLYEMPPMPPPDPNATSILNEKLINIVIFDAKVEILVLEGFCLLIFTIDLFLNFLICPSKKNFFTDVINIIHILVFVVMATSFCMEFLKGEMAGNPALGYLYFYIKAVNMIRIFLFVRFEKTFPAFRVLLLALRASVKELALMVLAFVVLTLFYSSVMFYFEIYGKQFYNIFICMWWAVITMTTVGYGDFAPTTTAGYILGVVCATSGILLISMPIAVIASNFSSYYLVHRDINLHRDTVAREQKKCFLEKLVQNLHSKTMLKLEVETKNEDSLKSFKDKDGPTELKLKSDEFCTEEFTREDKSIESDLNNEEYSKIEQELTTNSTNLDLNNERHSKIQQGTATTSAEPDFENEGYSKTRQRNMTHTNFNGSAKPPVDAQMKFYY